MPESIRIPERFNGPDGSANGGYTCGLVAAAVGPGPVEVSLRAPPPLERQLDVARDEAGAVTVTDGDTLVATGRPAKVAVEPPPPVDFEVAAAASSAGLDRWSGAHPFPRCFVCGPERAPDDGLRIFPGEFGDSGTFAATWTPEADPAGKVPPELIWAALDCPTSAPVVEFGDGPACVLAQLAVVIDGDVRAGQRHVLISWPLERDGRKRRSAVALYTPDGTVAARAEALWIALKEG
jgi:hypothetical protein